MADYAFSDLSNALEQRVRASLKEQPNRATVALNLARFTRGSGKNIAFDVPFGTDAAAEIADGADVSAYTTDTERQATLGWSIIHVAQSITGLAEAAAANEPNALQKLAVHKLMQAGKRLAATVNQRYISGTGTGSPVQALGLTATAGALDSTGVFMNIDRATYTQWASNLNDNGGVPRAVSLGLVDAILDSIYVASGEVPEYGITTPSVWRQIAQLHRDKERYVKEVTIKGQEIVLPGGQYAIEHDGIPIFKDKDWKAGSLAFLNSEHCGVEFLPAPQLPDDVEVLASVPIAGTPQEQSGIAKESRSLDAKLIRLARTGDKKKLALYLYYNVWADRCNALGLLDDLVP